ncbi:MAG: UTP--glucose-1-phosphate uridylyltransferase [Ilumatobacteraceae bacterium]
MTIRTVVIPAAGLGTRFLPATKSVPKELMPIFDTPAIQLVMDEAIGAGVEHIIVVSNRSKPAIEQYLTPSAEVVSRVRDSGRSDLADRLARIGNDVRVSVVYQDVPRGLGHAVGCARQAVGNESFAVLLPDELMGDSSLLTALWRAHDATGDSVIGLKRVDKSEVSAYGCVQIKAEPDQVGLVSVTDVMEKPLVADAPSDIIIIGRYVLTARVFDDIESLQPAANDEIQLTDALRIAARAGSLRGIVSDIDRHDTGTPRGWLEAVIEIALRRPDVGPSFEQWLRSRFH